MPRRRTLSPAEYRLWRRVCGILDRALAGGLDHAGWAKHLGLGEVWAELIGVYARSKGPEAPRKKKTT